MMGIKIERVIERMKEGWRRDRTMEIQGKRGR